MNLFVTLAYVTTKFCHDHLKVHGAERAMLGEVRLHASTQEICAGESDRRRKTSN
ncbi:hypothetical protein CY34DRAFT_587510 [Suillus luteus UH-Slu-Lm8-n1]|uniref:Uncharacterized protein n=1 Tax=Suillus luteus UH-Slu-Lm8-n1 TaxID=930992 RepID=A0A0D0AMA9_9AGAM|nr:hypothetical protein CY34DRAFT_587510 [Suillus luteus UH-Slu-Lm8-n1]